MRREFPTGVDVPALLAEEARLEAQLATIRQIKRALGLTGREAAGSSSGVSKTRRPAKRGRRAPSGRTWLDDIADILEEHGEPLHWKDIFQRIQLRRKVRSSQPAAVIRSYVRRGPSKGDDRVRLVGRGIYGLKEWTSKEGAPPAHE